MIWRLSIKRSKRLVHLLQWCILILCGFEAFAQPQLAGRITGGFQAPTSTDPQGRRHVLKGNDAEPAGTNIYRITEPRVVSFDAADDPEMFIEAPLCFLDMTSNEAWSDSDLSVRTADGRFSIEGTAWSWNPAAADLTISNQVVAFVQKSALAGMPSSTQADAPSATNAPVKITAISFSQSGDLASFIGQVVVQDGPDTLRCERLNLEIAKPGGVQKIEALRSVELTQGDTRVNSGRAVYDLVQNTLRLSENPKWIADQRQGSASVLTLNRARQMLFAEGQVYMKLPITNVVDSTDASGTAPARSIEIYSERFEFQEATSNRLARATYYENVRIVHPQATIRCAALLAEFDAEQRLSRITAENEVEIQSENSKAWGHRGIYDLSNEKITLTGNPRWAMDENTGRSELVIFLPKTKEIFALNQVEMFLARGPTENLLAVSPATNRPGENNEPMRVTAASFSHGSGVSVFIDDVEVSDAQGTMTCALLSVVTDATNQVQRIVAEENVRIQQRDMVATGSRAEYDVSTGLVHLTGDPELKTPGRELRAEAFIIDRKANTFSVAPGKYRIQLQVSESKRRSGRSR